MRPLISPDWWVAEKPLRRACLSGTSPSYPSRMAASKTPLVLPCMDCGKDRMAWARRPGRCPDCKRGHERQRAKLRRADGRWKKADPRAARAYALQYNYGLTIEKYDEMASRGCWICGSFDRLSVDHDHVCCPERRCCGRCVRGVVCNNCNVVLGRVRDDPHLLRALARYLEGPAKGAA